jgi:hypothetical protein
MAAPKRLTQMDKQILTLYAKGLAPVKSLLHLRKCKMLMCQQH